MPEYLYNGVGFVGRINMSDVLLATKIHIPPPRGNLVNRLHLIEHLNAGIVQGCRLILISAPAGYGKSTLLSEWVSQVGVPVAWLSLEKGENAPSRFWNYFATALQTIPHLYQAGIGEEILQAANASQQPPMDLLLANLVNAFSALDERAVLVLDDLHVITEGQIHRDLAFLIDHLPLSANGLRLVVASRMDPPWPLARWRARGELNELRPANLRFSHAETVQFLNQALPLQLSSQDVTALQDRTEGWIAGLQMAVVSLQGRLKAQGSQGISHFIETFTGSNRFVLDYLMEEVISQQPAEMRDFLHQTAILEQLTAPLCEALTGRHDSQALLEQVEHANLFLIPLDDERQWYRYHHLFTELLRKRLKQIQPEQIALLHQRASEWYAGQGILTEAISHALSAGDVIRVNEFISGNALAMVDQGELYDVLRQFEELPEAQFLSKPWLCVAYAWVKAYLSPSQGMEQILQRAEHCAESVENTFERQHLSSHLAAIRAYVAWVKGDADMALEFVRQALETLPGDDWVTRTHLLNIEGLAFQNRGDLQAAARSFEAAIRSGQKTARPHDTFFAYSNLAYDYILQGRLRQAFSLCQQVLNLAHQAGLVAQRMPVVAYAYATRSISQLEWSEVEAAIDSARKGVALAELWKQADALHFALTCLSRALCAAGDLEEAFRVNQRAMQLAAPVSPWFFQISARDEIMFNLVKGDLPAALHRFNEIEATAEDADKKGVFVITKASVLSAQGRFSEVLQFTGDAISEKAYRGELWQVMLLKPIRALALQALGQEEEALAVLGECLAFAAPEGYTRTFLEHGTPMARLLALAAGRGIEAAYANQLLSVFDKPVDRIPSSHGSHSEAVLIEPLSEREMQVLRLMDSALTNEEIGGELYVSVNTIRTHLRNIYAKLGVNRRGDAVRCAKELKLI
jgi:LuxR family maltose regulon positive regulatory protein